jgi:multidrug efflux pump subunit AcrA (membrane-fusion protein)
MRSMRPTLLLACFVLAPTSAFADQANSPPLTTAPAEFRTLPREYRLDGIIEAVNRSTVSAQTQGQIQEIFYDVDDFVEKGALLARIKDTEHRARVSQAAADLKAASARLRQTQDEHDRVADLYRQKNVSESAMDKARADLDSAKAELEAATARLQAAQEQLAHTEVRAPYSGIVIQRHVERGEIVSPGTPIMSGISLDALRVAVDVPQSVIPAVRGDTDASRRAWVYLPDGTRVESSRLTIFPWASRAVLPSASKIPRSPRCWPWSGCCSGCSRSRSHPAKKSRRSTSPSPTSSSPSPGPRPARSSTWWPDRPSRCSPRSRASSTSSRSRAPAWP